MTCAIFQQVYSMRISGQSNKPSRRKTSTYTHTHTHTNTHTHIHIHTHTHTHTRILYIDIFSVILITYILLHKFLLKDRHDNKISRQGTLMNEKKSLKGDFPARLLTNEMAEQLLKKRDQVR